ncbi:MAG: MBOAT family protein [Lachnospiraceae bacterium]|nr:MBOAT family protein [Lachnospiraceae bacterium]
MSYTSFVYFVLVALTAFLYYAAPIKYRWTILLLANTVFYLSAGPVEFIVLAVSVIASYFAADFIGGYNRKIKELKSMEEMGKEEKKQRKSVYAKKKRNLLWLGLGVPIGILLVVKYTNFVLSSVNTVLAWEGSAKNFSMVSLVVPLGISFFTFQIIAYVMDVYKGKIEPVQGIAKYYLYVSFFPSVVQGPIPRYAELGHQLERGNAFRFENVRDGCILILWGLAKKLIMAQRLATYVDSVYDPYMYYEGVILIVATIAFSVQIYADFSGCMDIAVGTAKIFGIELSPNFLRPYFSKTMPEFWRRWHATLGSWFRDYVFFPFSISKTSLKINKWSRTHLGDGAGKIVSVSLPILVVWILTGIWHGPEWKYVAWGLFHGILIVLSTIFSPKMQKLGERLHIKTDCFSFRLFQMLRTFALCCVGRVFFRAQSIGAAFEIFKLTFQTTGFYWLNGNHFFEYGIDRQDWMVVLVFFVIWFTVSVLEEKYGDVLQLLHKQNLVFRWAILYVLLFSVIIFGQYGPGYEVADFIYEQF